MKTWALENSTGGFYLFIYLGREVRNCFREMVEVFWESSGGKGAPLFSCIMIF